MVTGIWQDRSLLSYLTTVMAGNRRGKVTRKLAGFLVADAVGYSARIESNETAAINALSGTRSVIEAAAERHAGHIISIAGDGFIVEFRSAVEAVKAALDIQKAIESSQEDIFGLRIGVHFGDVSDEGDNLLGDGLNIAARLEPLSPEGGVLISGVVADQIVGKLEDSFVPVGARKVKNISRKLDLFCWPELAAKKMKRDGLLRRWPLVAASVAVVAAAIAIYFNTFEEIPLDERPRIAVMAFEDLSSGADKGYLGDGVAAGLQTELSRYREIGVIARNSSFEFRDNGHNVTEIADTLRADYLVEGGKHKSGNQIRISVRLIDGHDGTQIWADVYETDIGNLFDVQTRVVREITNQVGREVTSKPPPRGGREAVGALHYFIKGMEQFQAETSEGDLAARDLFQQAIDTEPNAPYGYVGMTWVYWRDAWSNEIFPERPRDAKLLTAGELADKAIKLDEKYHMAHVARADVHVAAGELEEALARFQIAETLNPNDVQVLVSVSDPLVFLGRAEEAITLLEKAIDLDPITPAWYFWQLGWAHWSLGQCQEGLAALRQMTRMPNNSLRVLAVLHMCNDDLEAARATMDEFRAVNPQRTVGQEIELFGTSWRNQDTMKRWADALVAAGMPL